MWDPYCMAKNGRYYMSSYYHYSSSGANYTDIGISHVGNRNGVGYKYVSALNGAVHHPDMTSAVTDNYNLDYGFSDLSISTDKNDLTFAIRMGGFSNAKACGINLVDYRWKPSYKATDTCVASLMLPPPGYTPYN